MNNTLFTHKTATANTLTSNITTHLSLFQPNTLCVFPCWY